jgi:hypothetical protein
MQPRSEKRPDVFAELRRPEADRAAGWHVHDFSQKF